MKTILELEGVQKLSKNQMKNVGGGGRRNCHLTGNEQLLENTYVCEWSCTRTFLGIGIGTVSGWGGCSVWG